MRILFITNLLPYPLDNGGKIKSYNTLEMLAEENKIDIFSFYESEKELESVVHLKNKFNDVIAIQKPLTTSKNIKLMMLKAMQSIFSSLPFVALKFKDKIMSLKLQEAIAKNNYDLIYIDHLQLAVYCNELSKAKRPMYLDQHNCESQIIKRQLDSSNSILKKIFLTLEYRKLRKFEGEMLRKANKVVVLSEEDKNTMTEGLTVDLNKFVSIPIPVEANYCKSLGSKEKDTLNILFLGTLSWYPNAQGISWFVNNVVPEMEKQQIKYKLYIVGKDPSEDIASKAKLNKNIIITGYVDDVNEYIEKCHVMVVPIFIGSGMRVKILEGLAKRIPIISTKVGAEGIAVKSGVDILLAEDEKEFVQSLLKVQDEEIYVKLQKNGLKIFNEKYSLEAVKKYYRKNVLQDESN